ncbi:valine--tRNA ligase [Rhodobacteraceae bacterium 2CG4]|uniref:Valine--tRNA ligase n=1 Tax=Halovulum marinum TaxID=2662447 RepID=A0A6L5YWD9_9RHOB|nr:valine--tRNA ligase [Halovulum marinum]MSU88631.1 valine--tRNA ligase [Halovulum marinum]
MAMTKTFDAAASEAAIAAAWEQAGAFRAGANASRDETFSIMIPPPNVTGSLHMGHAFNNTLQDILTRWHRMRGFDTLWQPGQDHAGIATQMVVERELARAGEPSRREMGREKFVEKVWEWKEQSGGRIVEQLKRLGASCDWSRNAFTMAGAAGDTRTGHENSANFHDAVLKVFVDLYDKGLIYRGKRLVNWDPHFETAISDLEVENIDVDGHMWHFKYPLAGGETYEYVEKDADGTITLRETRDYISIATTRPETMLGDGAVAVHPTDERYAPIVGKLCEIPVGPKEHRRLIPIITDEYPDKDFGSGAVKITGAHDFNDYQVAKRGGIPMYRLMDTRGNMRDDGAPYAECAARAQAIAEGAAFTEAEVDTLNLVPDELRGLDRFEARKLVIQQITGEGLAVTHEVTRTDKETGEEVTETVPFVENKKITQPFGDRSKVVIEPMLTDQWFVDTAKIVQPAIDAVRDGRTEILPEQHRRVYFNWLENIEPWCISRQLWWGHQIPVWYARIPDNLAAYIKWLDWMGDQENVVVQSDPPTDAVFEWLDIQVCAPTEELAVEELRKRIPYPAEIALEDTIGFDRDAPINVGPLIADDDSVPMVMAIRDPDVLDTWFSSGLWPIGTLGWPEQTEELKKYFPTNVLITGFDIIFFWVARMMMMQLEVVKEVPFHTVYVHALVRDEKGKKMSKSLGNVLDPLELIDEYGADAVRFTLTAMAAMGRDLKLSTSRIQGYRNFGTKLWNAARFAEMNDCKPDPEFDPGALTQTANRWIVGETARAREAVDAALNAYRFNDAANALYAHVWGKVCDWYVEFAKPLLADEATAAETRATMAWAIDQCLILLHPIMPFITEQLWGDIAERPKMLVHTDWPEYTEADLANAEADAEMGWVIGLIEDIRSVRAETHVPVGARIPLIRLELDAAGQAALERNRALIERLARVSQFQTAEAAPKGAVTLPVPGGTFCLPLADVIDLDEERARLEKAVGKLQKEMGGLKGKLNNAKFIANAPEEIVDEARARLEDLEAEAAKLAAAQKRLAEMV